MSDGYVVYREILNRLRCWAHLVRKAKGIAESFDKEAAAFGKRTHEVLKTLMDAVYKAREGPPGENLEEKYWQLLADFKAECERMLNSKHKKARALAVEFLNDWDAIFMVLRHPHLPLTSNEAERALGNPRKHFPALCWMMKVLFQNPQGLPGYLNGQAANR